MTTWQGTRACRGCDGSGFDYKHPDLSTFDSFEDCMVCGGTGRVEAKPPVADALADAETLRLNNYRTSRGRRVVVRDADTLQWMLTPTPSLLAEHTAHVFAARAARAAFRAVPGLRG